MIFYIKNGIWLIYLVQSLAQNISQSLAFGSMVKAKTLVSAKCYNGTFGSRPISTIQQTMQINNRHRHTNRRLE